ncbi:hypothetical protein KKC32_00935 [Patescibacteria group bacterium]|nr:hypothetical protein [Patescibacteria group bacterium]
MYRENIAAKSVRFIFVEIIGDFFYFPFWWYTGGVKKSLARMSDTVSQGNQEFGVTIWIKSLFKPMYGQYDWQGRIISFFMRLFQIVVRSMLLLFWTVFSVLVFFIWIFLPLFIILQILFNFGLFEINIL